MKTSKLYDSKYSVLKLYEVNGCAYMQRKVHSGDKNNNEYTKVNGKKNNLIFLTKLKHIVGFTESFLVLKVCPFSKASHFLTLLKLRRVSTTTRKVYVVINWIPKTS